MRVWLDPQKMFAFSLMPKDVLNAINNQNKEVSAGQLGAPPVSGHQSYQFTVKCQDNWQIRENLPILLSKVKLTQPNEAAPASSTARIIRIRDVGRVELGSSSYNQIARLNGKPTAAIGIFQLPGANALQIAKEVRATVAKMAKKFPPGLTYSIPFDTTIFVKASVNEVYKTLFEAGILVLVVIVVFLQNFRATLVPATTVPVTIIGCICRHVIAGLYHQFTDFICIGVGHWYCGG